MKFLICGLFFVSVVYAENSKNSAKKRELTLGYGQVFNQGYGGLNGGIQGNLQQKQNYNTADYSPAYIPVSIGGLHQGGYGGNVRAGDQSAQNLYQNQPQETLLDGRVTHITLHRQIQIPRYYPVPVAIQNQVQTPVQIPVHIKVDKPYPVHVPNPYPVPIDNQVPIEKFVQLPVQIPVKQPISSPIPQQYPVKFTQSTLGPAQKDVYVSGYKQEQFYENSNRGGSAYNDYNQQSQPIGNYQGHGDYGGNNNFGYSSGPGPEISENIAGGYANFGGISGLSH